MFKGDIPCKDNAGTSRLWSVPERLLMYTFAPCLLVIPIAIALLLQLLRFRSLARTDGRWWRVESWAS